MVYHFLDGRCLGELGWDTVQAGGYWELWEEFLDHILAGSDADEFF